jgi:hypothetical protein
MNNRMDSSSMTISNTPGQANYAALPVLETYVPENIVASVKQEHEGSYIYDITAIKAPMDSTMSHTNSMNSMNQNSTTMNSTSATTTTNSTGTDSSNQNTTATTNTNSNTTMGQNTNNMSAPQEYEYVVRYLQGGTMTTEILKNNGTKE